MTMHEEDDADDVAALLDFAGRRPQLPEAEVAPVRAAAREAFRRQARRTARRRRVVWAAGGSLAAGLLLAIGLILRPPAAPEAGPPVANVEILIGDAVMSGPVLRTGSGGRAAVRLPAGESLRIDAGSAVRFESSHLVTLEQGAVYVDADPALPHGPWIEIATPLGSVHHVGTQFEVRLLAEERTAAALRVRVREGTVLVRRAGERHEIRAGGELLLSEDGAPRRAGISVYGPDWDWVQSTARPFEIEGARLVDFLDWVSRETGLRWRLGEPRAGKAPQDVILHGSIEGLTAEEALSVVLPGCGYRSRRAGGQLLIESD
jgi:ferric-dicitrate binding protein FerR (iron transport regulator)